MTKEFWKAILIRTAKTWCQAFVGVIGIDSVKTLGDVNWTYALSVASLAAIVCFFWNLGAGLPEVELQQTLYSLDNVIDEEEEEEEEPEDIDEEGDEDGTAID